MCPSIFDICLHYLHFEQMKIPLETICLVKSLHHMWKKMWDHSWDLNPGSLTQRSAYTWQRSYHLSYLWDPNIQVLVQRFPPVAILSCVDHGYWSMKTLGTIMSYYMSK